MLQLVLLIMKKTLDKDPYSKLRRIFISNSFRLHEATATNGNPREIALIFTVENSHRIIVHRKP